MKVVFEPAARDELERILAWISKDNPRAALDMLARIEAKTTLLASRALAYIGRPGLVEETRELIEWPYIIVYKVNEERDEVVVISVVHGAQNREGGHDE